MNHTMPTNRKSNDERRVDATPLVSIIIPVFNDEAVIAGALDSCLRQTLDAIEIIVVDDASTDRTMEVVEQYASRDPRIKLIRQEENRSAYQARRVGIFAARADHVLFLDGDDELADHASETALAKAAATGADLVQFGIDVARADGGQGGKFESRLQPRLTALREADVLRHLFPIGRTAQGQLWRFLYRTQLLRAAYELLPSGLILPRVNDLPITFLAAALATHYVSVPDRLYRYHFGRGGSGQKVTDLGRAAFYAGAIDSIDSIEAAVHRIAEHSPQPEFILATYQSVRRSIIGYTTHYLTKHTRKDLLDETLTYLYTRAPAAEIVQATAEFWPSAIDVLAMHSSRIELRERTRRSILLATGTLRAGGVSGVLLAQAHILLSAGFRVTIAAREPGSDTSAVPAGVNFVEVGGPDLAAELRQWAEVCRSHEVDVVIDHHWLYSRKWPAFSLAARAEGAPTIAWAHNFAGRALLIGRKDIEFQTRHLDGVSQLVVLSRLDALFWKLRGIRRVVYLPNPPSPLVLEARDRGTARSLPSDRRIELVWWGRLEQRTKRVDELITVAIELQRLGFDFRMRIVGPDWHDMTAERLNQRASERGVGSRVVAVGPLYGRDLLAVIESSDLYVSTSAVEGYPLTITEAQSRGLPVAMYDLPWLAIAEGNAGIATVPQGEATQLAALIVDVATDPARYTRMSAGSIAGAERETAHDFVALYRGLIAGTLPEELDQEPTLDDVRRLIDLVILLSEQNASTVTPEHAHLKGGVTSLPAPRSVGLSRGSDGLAGRTRFTFLLTRIARAALQILPWLRPFAAKVKRVLAKH